MKSDERDQSRKTEPSVTVNFGKATKYRRVRTERDYPRSNNSGNQEWDDFEEILGNFGDWGDQ